MVSRVSRVNRGGGSIAQVTKWICCAEMEDSEAETSTGSSSTSILSMNGISTRQFTPVSVHTIQFAIPSGYSHQLEYVGGGTYGSVVKSKVMCRDGKTREVAIKKLKDPFMDPTQARRIYREIKLLQLMKHDNIIRALDLYTPDSSEQNFKDIYVVTEFAGHSLFKLLKNQEETGNQFITADHVQFIVYQLLRALKYLHSAAIIHRDLKPGNLALSTECDLTVLDFGLARSLERKDTGLTQYVMTRWYRSPEVIYWKIGSYTTQADIWSVGCIAAELMRGRPVFVGEDANAQYDSITRIVGSPDEALLDKIQNENSAAMRMVIESFEKHERVDFRQYFRGYPPAFIDFLDKILVLDPEMRLTVDGALAHEYMADLHRADDEPLAEWSLDDDMERSTHQWKSFIWKEVQNFRGDNQSPESLPLT